MATFHHFARTVRTIETSLAFYRDLLGLRVVVDEVLEGPVLDRELGVEGASLRLVELEGAEGRSRLELLEYRKPRGTQDRPLAQWDVGAAHVAVAVEDIDAVYRRLSAAGVSFVSPPQFVERGSYAGYWIADCTDPDGQTVELLQPLG